MNSADPTFESIKSRIVDYLQQHPAAADSARGIQRWWLPEREVALALVEAALEQLASEGRITRTLLPDGNTVWSAGSLPRPPHKHP
ncbi:hypothetical protein LMG27952_03981 [Paraburkholderia hiiakae]|uniref:DUF3253 domain-containing protein n=1 Tax=Paraburkholderia hiiakae TaxID=1081782 RepID=A0ABM8NTV0_9BURK|nr:hypothetical protein [Paraburkholderia hiiakae]CAD6543054.1 hypothetical protein LMG27952_03981 [Paraburkholderia hiiakae]